MGLQNIYLCYKCKLNGASFDNKTDWNLQDGSLKANLFYSDKLHLIKDGNAKLAESIYNSTNLYANINKKCTNFFKVICLRYRFQFKALKQEDFPLLPGHSVYNPNKLIVKFIPKSIVKTVSTSSVLPDKAISDSNACLSASSILQSKIIRGSNVRFSKPATSNNACPREYISRSNVPWSKHVRSSSICPSKPTFGSSFCPSKPISASDVGASKSICKKNILVFVIFVKA